MQAPSGRRVGQQQYYLSSAAEVLLQQYYLSTITAVLLGGRGRPLDAAVDKSSTTSVLLFLTPRWARAVLLYTALLLQSWMLLMLLLINQYSLLVLLENFNSFLLLLLPQMQALVSCNSCL